MSIWQIIKDNLAAKVRTHTVQETVPPPPALRGMLAHTAERCTACGTCVYVCSPGAIRVSEQDDLHAEWQYFAGQCTFCGKCVAYCPTQALCFENRPAPVSRDVEVYRVSHSMAYTACERCGKLFIPLPGHVLIQLYGDPLPAEIAAVRFLCDGCRNKNAVRSLKDALRGQLARRGADHLDRQTLYKAEEKE